MGGLVIKIRQWWDTADRAQRTVTIGGGAFLALMIAVTLMFASRPHMAPVFLGLNAVDQGSVVTELQKDGMNPEVNERGDVMVPSDKIADARIKLAAAGKLPATSGFGDEALAKLGIMDTPDVEKERLKTILEGRLNETIQSVDGIGSAQVHIVLADKSAFVRDKKPATASVSITERAGNSIGKSQAQAIATLVANSTPDLSINNVSVVNSHMEDALGRKRNWIRRPARSTARSSKPRRSARPGGASPICRRMLDPAFGPAQRHREDQLGVGLRRYGARDSHDERAGETATTALKTGRPRKWARVASLLGNATPAAAGSGAYQMDQTKFEPIVHQRGEQDLEPEAAVHAQVDGDRCYRQLGQGQGHCARAGNRRRIPRGPEGRRDAL